MNPFETPNQPVHRTGACLLSFRRAGSSAAYVAGGVSSPAPVGDRMRFMICRRERLSMANPAQNRTAAGEPVSDSGGCVCAVG